LGCRAFEFGLVEPGHRVAHVRFVVQRKMPLALRVDVRERALPKPLALCGIELSHDGTPFRIGIAHQPARDSFTGATSESAFPLHRSVAQATVGWPATGHPRHGRPVSLARRSSPTCPLYSAPPV